MVAIQNFTFASVQLKLTGSYDFAQNPSSAEAIFDGTLPPIQQCENDNGWFKLYKLALILINK